MVYQEDKQIKLRQRGSKQAIALAMQGRWKEAVVANKSIVENFPNDVDAYNRLGRAYIELGEYSLAREAYSLAVKLDPYNTIAKRNLDRLAHLEGMAGLESAYRKVEPQHFIKEAGKAGVVSLQRLAPKEIRAKMVAGDRVYLKIDGSSLVVQNNHGEYLGQVEPKHGQRLIRLMAGGNQYTAVIVSSAEEIMTVIIREVYQDPSQAGHVAFPPEGFRRMRPYIVDRLLRGEPENEAAERDESGYTVVGGDEIEFLGDESPDIDDKADNEE